MAVDTTNKKLAVIELEDIWEPGLPMSPGSLGQDDRQQLLWGYPGILWSFGVSLAFVLDLNTRLMVFLRDHYSIVGGDLNTEIERYLNGLSGDMQNRWKQLIQDATDTMV